MALNKAERVLFLLKGINPEGSGLYQTVAALGYSVKVCSVFDESEQTADAFSPDIILYDSGSVSLTEELIEVLIKLSRNSRTPIVLPASYASDENLFRLIKEAPCSFIPAEASSDLLNSVIQAAFYSCRQCFSSNTVKLADDLGKARAMLDDVLNTIPVRVFWKDLESVYLGCNRLFALDSGKASPEEIIGLTDYDIRDRERAGLNRADDKEIMAAGKPKINYEEPFITSDGEKNWIMTSKIPLKNRAGKMYGILGTYENITERKKLQEELILQRNRLSDILYGSHVGTWEWNVQTGINIVNKQWADIIGYSLDELYLNGRDSWKDFLHPDDLIDTEKELQKHFDGATEYFESYFRMQHKDGHWVWVLSRGRVSSRTADGYPLVVSGTHLDMSEQKKAEEEILNQLNEKEMILKETNHRIKNNLSSISSLLSLQANTDIPVEAQEALQDAGNRVMSMEVLYENLLNTEDHQNTSIVSYLKELVADIVAVQNINTDLEILYDIQDTAITPKKLFPIGLIVNESITNILKYAFKDRDYGKVKLCLWRKEDIVHLVIEDDGIGMPDKIVPGESGGFGLMLMDILIRQIEGEYKIDGSDGTKISIEIRDPQ